MFGKKKLKTDLPEVSDLDFDMDDDFGIDFEQGAEDVKSAKRNPVSDVVGGIKSGIKDTAKSPQFLKDTLRKSLPSNYGDVADAVDDISTTAAQLYDESIRELKPQIERIVQNVDRLLPENSKFLKGLSGKIKSIAGIREEIQSNQVNQIEATVQSTLGQVFAEQQKADAVSKGREVLKDRINQKQSDRAYEVQAETARDVSILRQYTTGVTQAYQKKHLELSLRSYLSQEDHQKKVVSYLEAFRVQFEGILKNTSLPEYAKITEWERLKEKGKNEMVQSLYGLGTPFRQGISRLKDTAMEFIGGVASSLSNIEAMIDQSASAKEQLVQMNEMLISIGEPPLTAANMAGAQIGSAALERLRDEVSKRILKRVEANPKLMSLISRAATMAINPAGAIDDLRRSDKFQDALNDFGLKGTAARGLDFILDHFTDQKSNLTSRNENGIDGLSGPASGFSQRAHISLVDIIPGHLAAIRREVQMIRTGGDAPLYKYDFERGEFVTQKDLTDRLRTRLAGEVIRGGTGWSVNAASDMFVGNDPEEEKHRREIQEFLLMTSKIGNMSMTPENIRNTSGYDKLSPKARALVDRKFSSIEEADEGKRDTDIAELSRRMMSIRGSTSGSSALVWGRIQKYIQAGYGDALEEANLVTRTPDGGFEATERGFEYFLDSNTMKALDSVRSDVNVKQDISEVAPNSLLSNVMEKLQGAAGKFKGKSPKDLIDGFKKTKLYNWRYKQGMGDESGHLGPMAQDLRRNIGEDVAPDGKSIDLQSMNGALIAGVKGLADEVEELKGAKRSGPGRKAVKDPVWLIQKDVAVIRKLNEDAMSGISSAKGFAFNAGQTGTFSGLFGNIPQDGSYKSMLLGLINGIGSLGLKAGSDAIEKSKNAFDFVNEKGVQPAWKFLQEKYDKYKDPTKDKLKQLLDGGLDLGKSALDFGKKFITEHIPEGFGKLKGWAKDVKDSALNWFNEQRDLYLPGGTEPVIRALKLKAGFYIDEETGEPITTIDQLARVKGNIVDKAGNIVLSLEERAKGLYDRHGETVKTNAVKLFHTAVGATLYAKDRLKSAFSTLAAKGRQSWGWVSDKFKEKMDGFSMGSFGSGLDKEARDAIVDIRDILLGKTDEVRKRLMSFDKRRSITELLEEVAETSGVSASAAAGEFVGPMPKSESMADMARRYVSSGKSLTEDLIGRGKEYIKGKGGAKGVANDLRQKGAAGVEAFKKSKVGTMASDRLAQARGKLAGTNLGQRAGDMFGRAKNSKWAAKGMSLGKSLGGGIMKLGGSLLSGAMGLFSGGGSAASGDMHTDATVAQQLAEGKEQGMAEKGGIIPQDQRQAGDNDGDGLRDGSVEAQRRRLEALKASRQKKAAEADLTRRYGSSGDMGGMMSKLFDALGSGFMNLMSFGKKGIGKIFSKAAGKFGAKGAAKAASAAASKAGAANAVASGVSKAGGAASKINWAAPAGKMLGTGSKVGGVAAAGTAAAAGSGMMGAAAKKLPLLGALLDVGFGMSDLMDDPNQEGGTYKSVWDFLSPFKHGAFVGKHVNKGINAGISGLVGRDATLGTVIGDLIEDPVSLFKDVMRKGKDGEKGGGGRDLIMKILGATPAGAGFKLMHSALNIVRFDMTRAEEIRLRQYGFAFNKDVQEHNKSIYQLENYLRDGKVKLSKTGESDLITKNIDPDVLMEIFKIEKSDKEQAAKFSRWFYKRFKPIFLQHVTAMYNAEPKAASFVEFEKLPPKKKIKYLKDIDMSDAPYDVIDSPVPSLSALSSEVVPIKRLIEGYVKELEGMKESKTDVPAPPPIVKPNAPADSPSDVAKDKVRMKMEGGLLGVFGLGKEGQEQAKKSKEITAAAKGTMLNESAAVAESDDGGKAPPDTAGGSTTVTNPGAAGPSALPMAGGALMTGTAQSQYVKLRSGVSLNGVHPRFLKHFYGMAEEYGRMTGKSIIVNSGYRSSADQMRLYNAASDKSKVSKPGNSVHETGLAVDIQSATANELDKLGLMKKYGFTRPVGKEPWHIEAAGIQGKLAQAKKDPGVADYLIHASLGRGGGGYGTDPSVQRVGRNDALAAKLFGAAPIMVPDKPAANDSAVPAVALKEDTPEAKSATNKLPPVPSTDPSAAPPATDTAKPGSEDGGNPEKTAALTKRAMARPGETATPIQSGPAPIRSAEVPAQPANTDSKERVHRAIASAQEARARAAQASSNHGLNLESVESALSTSNTHLAEIAQTLQVIASNVQLDRVAAVFSAAVGGGSSGGLADERKKEDQRRMGRTDQVRPASVDLARKAS